MLYAAGPEAVTQVQVELKRSAGDVLQLSYVVCKLSLANLVCIIIVGSSLILALTCYSLGLIHKTCELSLPSLFLVHVTVHTNQSQPILVQISTP